MIGISGRDILNKLDPAMDGLKKVSELIKCNGFFVFTLNSDDSYILSYGRMFAPAIGREGIVEVLVSIQYDEPTLVKIGGEAVVIFKTIIEI